MIKPEDISGFFAKRSLHKEDHLLVDFSFETTLDPKWAAAQLCSEQSTAQWKRPGQEEDFRPLYAAKVASLEAVAKTDGSHSCRVRIAHPIHNFGPRIPNILSAIAGEGAFYAPGIKTIRVLDLHFPSSFLKQFEGPQFGLKGLREAFKVHDRPFFLGVVKPNIGLDPASFAELAYQAWLGGLDIAKDDEMLADTEWSGTSLRMQNAGKKRKLAEKETGLPKMMIANLTDENDAIPALYKEAKKGGANAVMLNGLFTGMSTIRSLRKKSDLPIMGHFTGLALYDRIPGYGIDSVVWVKLQRLAGCDIIGIPGFGDRMMTPDHVVLANIKASLEPMGPILPALPVPGGSDWAGTLPTVFQKVGHSDFGFISGRGIFGHPQGPRSGAKSLHEAWEAIRTGSTLDDYAKNTHALAGALKAFGPA